MQTENISLYRRLHRMDLKQKPKSGKIIPHLLDSNNNNNNNNNNGLISVHP